jgi:hypothetical protein
VQKLLLTVMGWGLAHDKQLLPSREGWGLLRSCVNWELLLVQHNLLLEVVGSLLQLKAKKNEELNIYLNYVLWSVPDSDTKILWPKN